jgi:hypothetical protein
MRCTCGAVRSKSHRVGWRHKMPRRSHYVRAKELSGLECALDLRVDRTVSHSKTQSPFRRFVLLRLHGAEPGDDIRRLQVPCACNALVQKSSLCNLAVDERSRSGCRAAASRTAFAVR